MLLNEIYSILFKFCIIFLCMAIAQLDLLFSSWHPSLLLPMYTVYIPNNLYLLYINYIDNIKLVFNMLIKNTFENHRLIEYYR